MSLQSQKKFTRRKVLDRFFGLFCSMAILFAGVLLVSLLWNVWNEGAPRLGLKSRPTGALTGQLKIGAAEELQPLLRSVSEALAVESPNLKVQLKQTKSPARDLVYSSSDVVLSRAFERDQLAELERNRLEAIRLPVGVYNGEPVYLFIAKKSVSRPEIAGTLRFAMSDLPSRLGGAAEFTPSAAGDYEKGLGTLASLEESSLEKLGKFLSGLPSKLFPEQNGIKVALLGSLWVIGLTALISIPIGIAAAIFLEEFTLRKTKFTEFVQLNIANLAGVPSIVYGLLGLTLFVRWFALGRSVIAGSLTMSLLILPMIIIVAQEALRAVPRSYRDGSYAMGATHWQTIRRQVLPAALPGILTGIILSISRAMGETAPIITIGAVSFLMTVPSSINDSFTALPIQIYSWSDQPAATYREASAAAILVLLAVLILMNSVAIYLRYRYRVKA